MEYNNYRIRRVPIAITNYSDTISFLHNVIQKGGNGYVCVSNMRTVAYANENDDYLRIMENSLMNVPDGTPLIWCARWWGLKDAERVCGPHLFEKMLADTEHNFKHFFLGDVDDTLRALTNKASAIKGVLIAGSYSPPFKPLEEYDIEGMAKMINESGANIVWTSLRAPKQDYLGALLVPYLNKGVVVIGVGAAFRSYLGEYKAPDGLLQKMGLAGLGMMRNTTLWKELKWYVKHAIVLIGYFFTIKWNKIKGKEFPSD